MFCILLHKNKSGLHDDVIIFLGCCYRLQKMNVLLKVARHVLYFALRMLLKITKNEFI